MTLDARGLSCPQPVIMLKKALKGAKELTLLVDDDAAADNCTNYAKKQGYDVTRTAENGEFTLKVTAKR